MKEKIYIVMPAYNEAENIKKVVQDWYPVVEEICREQEACLMIANDASSDNTFALMEELKKDYPRFVPIDRPHAGHGGTLLFLYHKALEEGADYIFQTDSDGQTDPKEFWPMYRQRKEYDLQIGERTARGDGRSRSMVTRVLRWVVWAVFGVWVRDANTPFRLMNARCLRGILPYIPENFFLSNVAVSAIAVKQKKRICWQPITFKPRQGGVNSINLKRIVKIGFRSLKDLSHINLNLKQKTP